MLGLLQDLVELFTNIPDYFLYAIETAINLLMTSIEGLVLAAALVLPGLPEIVVPEFITEINWFFPIGLLIGIATPLLTGYVSWLSVKWIYKKVGDV